MTTEQAIRVFSEILENKGKISRMTYIKPIYIRLAIAALRAQQERENPQPYKRGWDGGCEMNAKRIKRLLLIAEMAQNETLTPSLVEYATIDACEAGVEALRAQQERENPKPLTLAIRSVQAERKRQDEKWGDQNGNHPFEWVSILGEEYGELCEAVNETFFKNGDKPERGGIDKMRKEAVQVAAVAVALIEALDKSDHGNIHDNPELVKEGNE